VKKPSDYTHYRPRTITGLALCGYDGSGSYTSATKHVTCPECRAKLADQTKETPDDPQA
jgi:hypothetical protein